LDQKNINNEVSYCIPKQLVEGQLVNTFYHSCLN